jgi:hypothetical protein
MIQRGGEVVIKMLPNVQQQTIKPIITGTIAPEAQVMTDEYDFLPSCLPGLRPPDDLPRALANTRAPKMVMAFVKSTSINTVNRNQAANAP